MTTYSYEALDRTHCIINSIEVNLLQHKFYSDNEEYRELIDKTIESLSDAYQVASQAWDFEESEGDL